MTASMSTAGRSEEHTSELQSLTNLVCRLLLEKKKKKSIAAQTKNTERKLERDLAREEIVRPHSASGRPLRLRSLLDRQTILFFFNDTATTEIYTLSLHDALPIWRQVRRRRLQGLRRPPRCRRPC